jgi:hypothetical protein
LSNATGYRCISSGTATSVFHTKYHAKGYIKPFNNDETGILNLPSPAHAVCRFCSPAGGKSELVVFAARDFRPGNHGAFKSRTPMKPFAKFPQIGNTTPDLREL